MRFGGLAPISPKLSELTPASPPIYTVAISKAAKLIDELVTEWDDLDTFQPDAAVAAMQDAHQLENAQKQTTEASAKKHFISREVSSSTGGIGALLSADALHKLANAMDRVNEVGKMGELPEGIEGGSQALVKILQMLDGWLRSGSMSFSLVEKKKKRQGEEDDEEEEDEDEEDLGTKLAEAKASVEAAYVVLAIMSGGAGKLERRVRWSLVFHLCRRPANISIIDSCRCFQRTCSSRFWSFSKLTCSRSSNHLCKASCQATTTARSN